jgi:hypothetical protein
MSKFSVEQSAGRLLRYLRTWQAPDGSLHGVHTHPVWRIHPAVVEDHYTGYSAWGAPGLLGLADLTARTGLPAVGAMGRDWVRYVLTTFMANDRWDCCGAELGRRYNDSPVDNFLQDLSLAYYARVAASTLTAGEKTRIGELVRRNLESYLREAGRPEAQGHLLVGTVNQDCAGLWAMAEWMQTFGADAQWRDLLLRGLHTHLREHFVGGLPDAESGGLLRATNLPDYIEPAEYYGVILPAYLHGWRLGGDAALLQAAVKLARHVMRNAWRDDRGCLRLHRTCDRVQGAWRVSRSPMLVAGGGLFLRALRELAAVTPLPEATPFLEAMDGTLAHYQNDYGFIVAATGWHDDYDLICGTVWEAHDLAYLGARVAGPAALAAALESPAPDLGIVIGWHDLWVESARQWSLLRPWSYGFSYSGDKHGAEGAPAIPAWGNPKRPEIPLVPEVKVRMVGDEIVIRAPGYPWLAVTSIYGKKWSREE